MATRTTPALVKATIETDPNITDSDIQGFIDVANELVTEKCTGSEGPATSYTTVRLELIERWLACHFYAVRDPRPTSESAGPVGQSFQSAVSLGFDTSHYGQTAMRLDTNGSLARLNNQIKKGTTKKAEVTWLGTAST